MAPKFCSAAPLVTRSDSSSDTSVGATSSAPARRDRRPASLLRQSSSTNATAAGVSRAKRSTAERTSASGIFAASGTTKAS